MKSHLWEVAAKSEWNDKLTDFPRVTVAVIEVITLAVAKFAVIVSTLAVAGADAVLRPADVGALIAVFICATRWVTCGGGHAGVLRCTDGVCATVGVVDARHARV